MRLLRRFPFSIIQDHLISYPTPSNLNYNWGFGSLAGLCLAIQIASGIFLAMHYIPQIDLAFGSVEHIMRDVQYGWLLRYVHSNGASFFFLVVYLHMSKGLYYGSYLSPRGILWASGVVIFFLMIITAFLGYVLPWGQMSLWGATVITNLVTAFPIIGQEIAYFLWGGFSVSGPTLTRFFSLHFVLPFAILAMVFIHLILLHKHGSSNPQGTESPDNTPFYPYFYVKDLLGFLWLLLAFGYMVFFEPNYLGHPDNYREADPLVTPSHIVPEWYLLPFYAILRSIPNKLLGVLAMLAAIVSLFLLPIVDRSRVSSGRFRPVFKFFFWYFIANFIILGWIGSNPIEFPYYTIGKFATFFYFFFIFFILPLAHEIEKFSIDYLTKIDSKVENNKEPEKNKSTKKKRSLFLYPLSEIKVVIDPSKFKKNGPYSSIY